MTSSPTQAAITDPFNSARKAPQTRLHTILTSMSARHSSAQTSKASRDKPSSGSKSHDPCRGRSPRRTHRRLPLPASERADGRRHLGRSALELRDQPADPDQPRPERAGQTHLRLGRYPLRADPGGPIYGMNFRHTPAGGWATRSHASRWMPSESCCTSSSSAAAGSNLLATSSGAFALQPARTLAGYSAQDRRPSSRRLSRQPEPGTGLTDGCLPDQVPGGRAFRINPATSSVTIC
jgi:hypothetical protein